MTAPKDQLSPTAETRERLRAIRDRARASFAGNLATIDAALGRLWVDALGEPERRAAQHAAHRLAGAAGMFGFPQATEPARQLEETFADNPQPEQADRLASQAATLRAALLQDDSSAVQEEEPRPDGVLAASHRSRGHGPPPVDPTVRAYYATLVERTRLETTGHGRLERLRTQELLRHTLPSPPARVLDVGGGTGVYAQWLAESGYDVHLVDVVPEHVSTALAGRPAFTAAIGDARHLKEADNSADAVLMLGPLFHLLDREDRLQALGEAQRVLRAGGTLAAAVVSRHAALLAFASRGELDQARRDLALSTLADGHLDPQLGFTTAFFHTPEGAVAELRQAGFRNVRVRAIEGPMWAAVKICTDPVRLNSLIDSALICARALEDDPAILAASAHLLVTGQA